MRSVRVRRDRRPLSNRRSRSFRARSKTIDVTNRAEVLAVINSCIGTKLIKQWYALAWSPLSRSTRSRLRAPSARMRLFFG